MQTLQQNRIIKDTQEAESHIAQMVEMPDNKLSKNLDIVRQQMEMAYQANKQDAVALMQVWERQIIEARVMKFDMEVLEKLKQDATKNSISLAQHNTETQLQRMLKKTEALSKQAATNDYANLLLIYAEEIAQIQEAIKMIQKHEEKYTIIRKLINNIKLTSFERKILDLNRDWVWEIEKP